MSHVIVFADHPNGELSRITLEMTTLARRIGSPIVLVRHQVSDEMHALLRDHGADLILEIDDDVIKDHPVVPAVEALHHVVERHPTSAVLLASTLEGKEIAGRLCIRMGSGVITDAVDVGSDGVATQSIFGGSTVVTSRVTQGIPVITVRPNSVTPEQVPGTGAREVLTMTFSALATAARVVERSTAAASTRPQLAEASAVVTGGRGVGSPEGFAVVEDLADALGAAVGASRAAVDAGWYPHKFQVGQTGTTVSPQVYLAAGVSGAIQHRAGMQTSKVIVVVNKDAEAPLFSIADFGIVGDLFDVLPQLTDVVRAQRKS